MQKRCDSKGTNGNELVQCAGEHAHDGLHHQWSEDHRKLSTTELWWNGSGARCFVNVCPTDTIAVRRANAEAVIASQKTKLAESPKYYGAQPDVLPETLPAETWTRNGVSVAKSALTLRAASGGIAAAYIGKWQADAMGPNAYEGAAWADTIDWNTVLVQEAKPPCECAGVNLARGECGKCGRAARPPITEIKTQAQADALALELLNAEALVVKESRSDYMVKAVQERAARRRAGM